MSTTTFFVSVALLAGFGLVVDDPYVLHVMIIAFIWCGVIASWDMIMGYCGITNFAQLVFFAVGGYAVAMISKMAGLDPAYSILFAIAFSVIVGVLVGIPCLRLTGEIAALFTFAVHLAMPALLEEGRHFGTGGSAGLMGMRPIDLFGHVLNTRAKTGWYFLTLTVSASVCYLIYCVLLRGRVGRAFVTLRDAEPAALSLGVDDRHYKLLAFAISAGVAGLCGALYTLYLGIISPGVLGTEFFLIAMAMLSIGGLGRYPGAIAGSFIVTVGNEALRSTGEYRLLILGCVVIFAIIYMPNGIVKGLRNLVCFSWLSEKKSTHVTSEIN